MKKRLTFLFAAGLSVILGLGVREFRRYVPDYLDFWVGDAIWAMMIFWMVCFIKPSSKFVYNALTALLFCYTIELSQLYQADWINDLRSTTFGTLVLGHGFLWSDLLAYSFGVSFGYLITYQFIKNRN
jgi:hypothetical protein